MKVETRCRDAIHGVRSGRSGYADDAAAALSRHLFGAGARYPFLRETLERMERIPDAAVTGPATDGRRVFYNPDIAPEPADVQHMLIHCLFRHLVPPEEAVRPLWDLACDLSAEYLRAELFPSREVRATRLRIAEVLPEDADPRVAAAVYDALSDRFGDAPEGLAARFGRDDHRYWYAPPAGLSDGRATCAGAPAGRGAGGGRSACARQIEEGLRTLWPPADALPGGAPMTGRYGLAPGSREERMLLRAEGKYDFSRYLRRFSTTREEMRLDLGGFDYIPYYYGLMRYGNMPLIEPLEYAESRKVEELVIAIDTSASCRRPVVERFLAEIQRILMRRDDFFSTMNIHIIQCDAVIQSHAVIRSPEDWEAYTRDVVIRGRGGTDFTPVFALVEKLQRQKALKNLRGLLYFTDGDGTYPQTKTPYETAFVFTSRKALGYKRPDWIVPLCLENAHQSRGMTP